MNRKLRNSLSAFTASGAALAIALMVAVPAGTSPVQQMVSQDLLLPAAAGQRAEGSLAQAVALSAEFAAASALALEADRRMDAPTKPHAPRKGTRNRRQTVVMPYFSFLPRG
ncbi:hypothetical protein [Lysobacter solisilvae (ex Woo and Kim 2020)]|uniref:Uncharacterized protein n=1 Tax=Agrilutibacter terrestris TaxID=2865112 RepID=A0A7H0FXS2_9GAMM|nr:hypothetical protein [Lysobacter terrestris]QNP40838.1 hypothetical protein H8B22_00785 [Lysobacter terrestris]